MSSQMENLIFERHFDLDKEMKLLSSSSGGPKPDPSLQVDPLVDNGANDANEDLGIIDLDSDDVLDEFDDLDDDKLPVLKNTYSKKSRPNNSKSVAVGSRSQGGDIKRRNANKVEEEEKVSEKEEKGQDNLLMKVMEVPMELDLDNSQELKEDLDEGNKVAQEMNNTLSVKQKMNLSMSKELI
mmetsp:Transcript_23109/g.22519  ORF Transcript_23109/g.22519 Transcript_23109/m.22519 type:complete len:183 (-) Transcript_23109:291-839(-)